MNISKPSVNSSTHLNEEYMEGIVSSLKSHQLWIANSNEGSQASFMHLDFKDFDFSGFDISNIVFKNCTFENATFTNKDVKEVTFYNCDLSGSTFFIDSLKSVLFEHSNLSSATFVKSSFLNCNFKDCSALEASFAKAIFETCNFSKINFQFTDFNSSEFFECLFFQSHFALTDFAYSSLAKCKFENAIFTGADMHSSKFILCHFLETKFTSFKKKNGTAIKTSLKNIVFRDCGFVKCFFEERREFLEEKIVKTKTNHKIPFNGIYKPIFISLKVITSACLVLILFLIAKQKITQLSALLLGVTATALIYAKIIILNKFTHFKNKQKTQLIIAIFFAILVFVSFFSNWLFSLQYQNFNFSTSLLLLFCLSTFNIALYIKTLLLKKQN